MYLLPYSWPQNKQCKPQLPQVRNGLLTEQPATLTQRLSQLDTLTYAAVRAFQTWMLLSCRVLHIQAQLWSSPFHVLQPASPM